MKKVIEDDKMKHIHGVAEYMYSHAEKFGIDSPEDMYVVGLLHSIGTIRNRNKDDVDSVDILRMLNFPERYSTVIKCNNMSPDEYKKYYGVTDGQIPKIQILMWVANLIINFNGDVCDPYERVEQIEQWHIENNLNDSHSARKTANWLRDRGYL